MGAGPFSITAVSSAVFLFCIPRENNIVVPLQKPPHEMYGGFFGDPVGIRTLDLLIRSQSLYPAELPSHDEKYSHNRTSTPPSLRYDFSARYARWGTTYECIMYRLSITGFYRQKSNNFPGVLFITIVMIRSQPIYHSIRDGYSIKS